MAKSQIKSVLSLVVLVLGLVFTVNASAQVESNEQNAVQDVAQDAAQESKCISADDMSVIAKNFKQFKNLAGKEYCFDNSQTAYLIAGIQYIRKLQFDESGVNSPDELFTGQFAKDWYGYFTGLITKFVIDKECEPGVIAYVFGGGLGGKTMYVCPMALTDAFTPLDLASVFMHEARHIQGHPHRTCTWGPRKNLQGACDQRISEGGSYAVTVETYSQLAKHGKNIHPAFKAIAEASALIYAEESFEIPVKINKQESFVVLSEAKQMFRLDAELKKPAELLGQTANLGRLIKSKSGLHIMPNDRTLPMTKIYQTGETQNLTSGEYNKNVAERSKAVDYYFAWLWNARIEKNVVKFFCDKREFPDAVSEVSLNDAEALAIVYPEAYAADKNYAFINTTKGIMKISCDGRKGKVEDTNLKVDTDILRLHKIGNTSLALTTTGDLLSIDSTGSIQKIDTNANIMTDISAVTRAQFFDSK